MLKGKNWAIDRSRISIIQLWHQTAESSIQIVGRNIGHLCQLNVESSALATYLSSRLISQLTIWAPIRKVYFGIISIGQAHQNHKPAGLGPSLTRFCDNGLSKIWECGWLTCKIKKFWNVTVWNHLQVAVLHFSSHKHPSATIHLHRFCQIRQNRRSWTKEKKVANQIWGFRITNCYNKFDW